MPKNLLILNPYHLYVKKITVISHNIKSCKKSSLFLWNFTIISYPEVSDFDFENFRYLYLIFSFYENARGMSHESLDQPESGSKRAPSGVNETNYNLILICQLASCHLRGACDAACSIGAQNTGAWSSVSDKKSKQWLLLLEE